MIQAPAAASAPSPPPDAGWLQESAQWFETIDPGGTVRVVNPMGDIHARFGGYEQRVEILATIQHEASGDAPPRVELTRVGPGLDVTTGVPARENRADSPGSGARVDLVIFVPQGAILDAETRRDHIDIKGVEGDVNASSLKGDIDVRSVNGAVQAKTAHGAIHAVLETGVTARPQSFVTETGDVEVYLGEDADVEVRIATSGEISTDFSIEIEHRKFEEPGKHARATVGQGGPGLELRSKRGRVRLLRLQKDFRAE